MRADSILSSLIIWYHDDKLKISLLHNRKARDFFFRRVNEKKLKVYATTNEQNFNKSGFYCTQGDDINPLMKLLVDKIQKLEHYGCIWWLNEVVALTEFIILKLYLCFKLYFWWDTYVYFFILFNTQCNKLHGMKAHNIRNEHM